MKVGSNCILLCLIFHIRATVARVYETDDAIVTVADQGSYRASRFHDDFYSRLAYQHKQFGPHQFVDPEEKSCMTFDRRIGTCLSLRECYPALKYFEIDEDSAGIYDPLFGLSLSKRGCNYVEPDGRMFNGVCCLPKLFNRTTVLNNKDELKINKKPEKIEVGGGSRIVNGEDAKLGEFPFMVGIESNGKFLCGGSLIDANYVLTAAHCVNRLSPSGVAKLIAFMGVADLGDNTNRVTRRIHSITRHRDFDGQKLHNDVALMRLMKPVEFSSNVAPACLSGNTALNGGNALAIGWGRTSDGGPRSETLQKVTLQIKSNEDCKDNFGPKAPGGIIDTFLCATAPEKDACGGDSGGPLMSGGCQVGIVSWGIGCATDTYGVYTRIASFSKWIENNKKPI